MQNYVNVIVFDTETNGLEECSVLSISAIKLSVNKENLKVSEISRFNRYYFRNPGEEINESAIFVNGLTDLEIEKRRIGENYAKYFEKDIDFLKFCKGCNHFVAHNIEFDRKFIPFELKHQFCTKVENVEILKIPGKYGKYKWPRLNETAFYYGIVLDENEWHGSEYDTEICKDIFVAMLEDEETQHLVKKFLEK